MPVITHSITEPGVYEPISDTERGLMLVFEERFGTQVCVCERALSPSLPPFLSRVLSLSRARALSFARTRYLSPSFPPSSCTLACLLSRSLSPLAALSP